MTPFPARSLLKIISSVAEMFGLLCQVLLGIVKALSCECLVALLKQERFLSSFNGCAFREITGE